MKWELLGSSVVVACSVFRCVWRSLELTQPQNYYIIELLCFPECISCCFLPRPLIISSTQIMLFGLLCCCLVASAAANRDLTEFFLRTMDTPLSSLTPSEASNSFQVALSFVFSSYRSEVPHPPTSPRIPPNLMSSLFSLQKRIILTSLRRSCPPSRRRGLCRPYGLWVERTEP